MRRMRIQPKGFNSCTEPDIETGLATLREMLIEAELHEIYEISLVEMTDEEYNNLPEFQGF